MTYGFYLWESLKNKTNRHILEELRNDMRRYSLTVSFGRTPETCSATILSASVQEVKISIRDIALVLFFY
jgi:hypothetical protein